MAEAKVITRNSSDPHGRKYKAHISDKKKGVVSEFSKLIAQYDVIAAVNLENLPARQLQNMKDKLRGSVLLKMTKQRLITIALDESKKSNVGELKKHLKGMPALLFTNQSPFLLFNTIKKSKSKAPIKGGQKAPHEIVVKAGITSFAPGPIIGELGQYKIKSGIEGGKVAIKADSVVAKEGDVVDQKLASILQRLGVEPMEIGLEITAVYEHGQILTKDVLDIDETKYAADIMQAYRDTMSVALEIGHLSDETMPLLVQKAYKDALALAVEQGIMEDDAVQFILAKIESAARALEEAAK